MATTFTNGGTTEKNRNIVSGYNITAVVPCGNRKSVVVYCAAATVSKSYSRINEGNKINVTKQQQLCHYGNLAVRNAM